jgi:hypothetical protein
MKFPQLVPQALRDETEDSRAELPTRPWFQAGPKCPCGSSHQVRSPWVQQKKKITKTLH